MKRSKPKPQQPKSQNWRIVRLAGWLASVPVVVAAAMYARGKNLGKSEKTIEAEDHAKDQLRQSRARRKLRGLSPDHVEKDHS